MIHSRQPVAQAFRPEAFHCLTAIHSTSQVFLNPAAHFRQIRSTLRFPLRRFRRFRRGKSSKNVTASFLGSACINAPSTAPSIARACRAQNRDPSSAIRTHGTQALRLPAIA
ncbi:MAG TPA: hypothetical protein VFI45_14870 [Candidatus Acidoferrum sp.]|nr:hypothetical protein [Candidatus Acidoferrum sp.]